MKALIFKVILPLIIVGIGVAALIQLKGKVKKAEHVEPQERVLMVETETVSLQSLPMKVTASGSVRAAKQIVLTPEVTGRITYISPNLIPGSRFAAGELIARIDKRDYKLALEQQVGQVEQAKLNLTVEQSRGQVAKEEWALLTGGSPSQDDNQASLALRKPYLEEARQAEQSARSGLDRAKLNLKKTVIKAPFDALVLEKGVDIGQVVGPSSQVVSLMGTEELWVDVSVPVEQLSSIQIPGFNSDTGSPATVIQKVGGDRSVLRTGTVIRLQGQLDSRNRTATLLVSVPNPFDAKDGALPLLAGAYVEVEIHGDVMTDVVRIPRGALREGVYVWLATKDNRMKRRDVVVGWREPENVIVTSGLAGGDEIITSPVSFPLDGMRIHRVDEKVVSSAKLPDTDHDKSKRSIDGATTATSDTEK
ncbi:MAG: efflux RND transporter periplasmic adaptor subunit [Deltaproteobacteria bacterium]|nr:efflux RND transporter periplasmic adaptor subunit [Deltaproteobacteria bacterium]MBN2673332.1 efflux RND transporter periplasmic adaptor subunit [Deltaproteobacteria bacterium]